MKKIIIHLGPPKTGSTTIQSLLKSHLASNHLDKDVGVSKRIYAYINGNDKNNIFELKNEIECLLLKTDFLVYSDERVLMEYSVNKDWTEQLKRLYQIFDIHDVELEVVIVVRNPTDAIPSLFQQMRGVNWVASLTLESFILSHQAKIYNYKILEGNIIQAGFENIKYLPFELFQEEELHLNLLGIKESVKNINAKNKSNTNEFGRIYSYRASDIFKRNFRFLSPLFSDKMKIVVARKLNFKLFEEKIRKDITLPNEFIVAYEKVLLNIIK
jgi:hypothetical protein